MKRFLCIMLTLGLLVSVSVASAFAQCLPIRIGKAILSPIVAPIETVATTLKSLCTGENGPIGSVTKGVVNGVGRVAGDITNIFEEDSYSVSYFKDNELASKISEPFLVKVADWAASGMVVGIAGVNSGWWGGRAYSWTRVKAATIGLAGGVLVTSGIDIANIELE